MTKTKVLPSRKKKASKGHLIRISDEVYECLVKKRQGRKSWDATLRRIFGLAERNGERTVLVEGWLEQNSGRFFFDIAEARGEAVLAAAKAKTEKVKKPIRMREVV